MDVQTYMQGVGKAARVASRAMAKAQTQAKDRALLAMADAITRDEERLLAANAEDLAAAQAQGLEPALLDRLTLSAKGVQSMADGLRQIAALRDPVGEITRAELPAVRHPGRPHARAARRDRHHLRGAPERHRGCGGALPQGGQRDHPARRLGGHSLEPGDRRVRPRGPARSRSAGGRGAGGRDDGSGCGGRAPAPGRLRRRDRAAWRQGARRAHHRGIAHPDDQAPGRRVPRLPRRPRRHRNGDPHRRQRQDPALRHVQHDGDAARPSSHRPAASCPASRRSISRRGSS